MGVLISGLRFPFEAPQEDIIARALKICPGDTPVIRRRALDLRHGVSAVYTVEVSAPGTEELLKSGAVIPGLSLKPEAAMPKRLSAREPEHRPVVVGAGPAGLFAALVLAENGLRPIILEKGPAIAERDRAVDEFFRTGKLDPNANIQFGEGGAGTYSDGKLNTRINNPDCLLVEEVLIAHGAPAEAMIPARPHLGTDLLKGVVTSIRKHIEALGGEFRFSTPVSGFRIEGGALKAVKVPGGEVAADTCVLACGHSARDIYLWAHGAGLSMEKKPFSVGVRAEHLQEDIDLALYGRAAGMPGLPPGEYLLSKSGGRGCYSFCMCPGGEVVAAASEEGGTVTNGMSYHARSGKNANSAICVSILPSDLEDHVLSGMEFQRTLERAAYKMGGGYSPVSQMYGDFLEGRVRTRFGRVEPSCRRGVVSGDIGRILPSFVTDEIKAAMPYFGKKIRGFDASDTLFSAVETRTSAPVRIIRGPALSSPEARGLIPCGEGAGYAGGIVSAACDGIRAARQILEDLN